MYVLKSTVYVCTLEYVYMYPISCLNTKHIYKKTHRAEADELNGVRYVCRVFSPAAPSRISQRLSTSCSYTKLPDGVWGGYRSDSTR